jgi:hypothetical protein
MGWVPNDGHSFHARRDLLQQLQPFSGQAVLEWHEAGGVAARPRQAVDEAGADRIDNGGEHDWNGARRLQQRRHGRGAGSQDDVRRKRGQFNRVFANALGIAAAPADVDLHVTAVGPTQLLHGLLERREAGLCIRIVCVRGSAKEHADAPHALLRASGERHRCRRTT